MSVIAFPKQASVFQPVAHYIRLGETSYRKVADLAAAGVILGLIATGISALLGLLREGYQPNHVIVAGCLALSVLIFILANLGMLSVVQ